MDNLEQIDKDYILHTYNRDYTHFTHGENAKLYDINKEMYIDFTSGIGVNSLGHNNKSLVEAISNQASKILHLSNIFLIESQAKLAKKLVELSMYKMRVFFSNSGLEANECAIKIARKYGESSNRFKIITLKNSFHGRSIATLKACAQDKMHKHFAPFPEGFLYAENINEAIKMAKERKRVIAIMLELIQGEGGVYAMPKDEVKSLESFCKNNDILLIIDEVQSGIYRSGELLASNLYEISPDIITLAKGLGGGVPIGATMTNKIDIFEVGDHGSTFGGNFLASTAGLCVLETLESFKKSNELDSNIHYFSKQLEKICKNNQNIFIDVSGIGFMRGIKTKDENLLAMIIKKAKKHHLLVLKSGNATLRLLPPITITKDEINQGFIRLQNALDEINAEL